MNFYIRACFWIAILALAASVPSQRTWKVHHAGGPGVDFTDLPPAVAAASPGDEIWVYSQTGTTLPYYTPAIIDKGRVGEPL